MSDDADLKKNEYDLKRVEFFAKVVEAATERQFKLASFALGGNVAAIAACGLAVKDSKTGIDVQIISSALHSLTMGAILATISLGIVLLSSEATAAMLYSVLKTGPAKLDELVSQNSRPLVVGTGLLIFSGLYGFSAYYFFSGLSLIVGSLK
jgi:hypothetical protein